MLSENITVICVNHWAASAFSVAVEAAMTPGELREKAARYRQMAKNLADRQAVAALQELAEKYEDLAAKLEVADGSSENE